MAAGFSPERGSYTRSYGSNDLDAAVLVLPLLDLEPRDSPRVRATIEAVRRELSAGGPLLYRYPPGQDGLPGTEGAFLPCSFWLVQALASTGRVDEAAQLFADLLELANRLGLLPEEINPKNHCYLGNYPQALTHAALIQAALAIRDAQPDRPVPSSRPRPRLGSAPDQGGKHRGLTDLGMPGRGEQRQRAARGQLLQVL
jgi:GH15 family glucan-1,4-alpha-glucosidase